MTLPLEKRRYVDSLTGGDRVEDIFALAEKILARKKNGEPYLRLSFSDRTGQISAVVWDRVDRFSTAASAGDIVWISATVSDYKGTPQLTLSHMERVDAAEIDPLIFLPRSERDPDRMFERLKRTAGESINDPHLAALINAFFSDAEFVSAFKLAPAAKRMHHAYLGGLLEHTLSMTVLAREVARHYSGVNLDLLMTGVILHDIGKVRELSWGAALGYTDEGRLVSHIVQGVCMVDEKLRGLPGFPPETAMLVKHLIVSHHGTREFGSPEPPKTLEAVLLHHIDNIDAKMNGLREFIAREDPASAWTSRNFMLGTEIYKGAS